MDGKIDSEREYTFSRGSENVYGDYVHATFVRRMRWKWIGLALFCFGMAIFCVLVVLNPDLAARMGETARSPLTRFSAAVVPIIAPFCIPLGIVLFALGFFPLFRFGCNVGNFAWPRFYGRQCASKNAKPKYRSIGKAYFSSFERRAMEAVVDEGTVRVSEPDGSKRVFALRNARRVYRAHGLVILESGPADLPSGDVILDVSGMGRDERREFFRFLDSRLPADCKCYYRRLGRPPKGAAAAKEGREEVPGGIGEARESSSPGGARLPIGSVVRLAGYGDRTFMVYGRMASDGRGRVRDYLVCAYPEGRQFAGELNANWFADRDEVSEVLFEGYRSKREEDLVEFMKRGEKGGVWDV